MEDLTYDEVRIKIETSKLCNLLLGNGFSIQFDDAFKELSNLEQNNSSEELNIKEKLNQC